ncbi:hypothetical protein SAMN06265222_12825 [Neorhodopirellula lusitana]|uniref:Uncharacterized protein n=1 Tax=Neorhodopirellula lusitana TaxID=445327 RepID=A0ABY1QVC5_9BACT|nr:hypothetical protein SAMN06265222_12825 [Neorhodopirellula lusitana]
MPSIQVILPHNNWLTPGRSTDIQTINGKHKDPAHVTLINCGKVLDYFNPTSYQWVSMFKGEGRIACPSVDAIHAMLGSAWNVMTARQRTGRELLDGRARIGAVVR